MDVIAVNLETKKVRIFARGKDEKNAEAIVNMAVIRRGVDEEFYTTTPDGKYNEGDVYGK